MNVPSFTRPLFYQGLSSPELHRDTRELSHWCLHTDQSQWDANRNIGQIDVTEIGARTQVAYKKWDHPIESETYRLVTLQTPEGTTKQTATSVQVLDGRVRVAEVTKDASGEYHGQEYSDLTSRSQPVRPQPMDPDAAREEFAKVYLNTLELDPLSE